MGVCHTSDEGFLLEHQAFASVTPEEKLESLLPADSHRTQGRFKVILPFFHSHSLVFVSFASLCLVPLDPSLLWLVQLIPTHESREDNCVVECVFWVNSGALRDFELFDSRVLSCIFVAKKASETRTVAPHLKRQRFRTTQLSLCYQLSAASTTLRSYNLSFVLAW